MNKIAALFWCVLLFVSACNKKPDYAPNYWAFTNCDEVVKNTDSLLLLAMQLTYDGALADTNHPAHENVLFPTLQLDSLYFQLKAIQGLKSPESDTLFKLCKIQRYYTDSLLRTFSMHIIRNKCNEKLSYYSNAQPCSAIDSMLLLYNINTTKAKLAPHPSIPNQQQYNLTFRACKPLNMAALIHKIKQTGLADDVFPYFTIKNSPFKINIKKLPTHTELEFGYGWGNCTWACNYWRYWVFRVDAANKVTFVNSYGDDGPVL